jgi:hypothetical protein
MPICEKLPKADSYARRIREALMASEQVMTQDSKGEGARLSLPPCWQVYATVADADECRTKHGNPLTD